jgi:SAM-dependent methyltransferase
MPNGMAVAAELPIDARQAQCSRRRARSQSGKVRPVPDNDHWERVYATRSTTQVSWYEREPATSLGIIDGVGLDASAAIIDVGAGASSLVDCLLNRGFTDLTVLDISQRVLDEVHQRLGKPACQVTFVAHDVLTWEPDRRFDLWHDRAVFHFLVDSADQHRYVQLVGRAVRHGGTVIVATFADDGPSMCSGLPVSRYSATGLAATFSPTFTRIADQREEHVTPTGIVQPFTWAVLRRT